MIPSIEVTTFDTTLRDGAQALPHGNQFRESSKPEIAEQLAQIGVGVIEAGFPATPGDGEEVREVAKSVGNNEYEVKYWTNEGSIETHRRAPIIAGLSRTTPSDVEATWESIESALNPRIHTFISTDTDHMRAKFPGKTPADVLKMGIEAINHARELAKDHPGATVEFSAEAASTTDNAYLEDVVKSAIQAGADVINLPDTVGQRYPEWMKSFYLRAIGWAMQEKSDTVISAHNHNDLGLATANTFALVQAAAEYASSSGSQVNIQAETTICGLGERAGNADLFQFVGGLFKFSPEFATPMYWEFNPEKSVNAAKVIMAHAGLEVPRQAPLVGSDINTHRSGIHSSAVIKGGHKLYTPHDPAFWGHSTNAIHEEGKYQGRAGRDAAIKG